MNRQPRRPAQLSPEQIEAIEGETDVAYNSELAHTSAQALLPMGRNHIEYDPAVRDRILQLVADEGVDVIAEAWVRSPHDTLPGILWRVYLLREWLEREHPTVKARFTAATQLLTDSGNTEKLALIPHPESLKNALTIVLNGTFDGYIDEVLRDCARLTDVLADANPAWIDDDRHELATAVTRRDRAMALTSREFREAAELALKGGLE